MPATLPFAAFVFRTTATPRVVRRLHLHGGVHLADNTRQGLERVCRDVLGPPPVRVRNTGASRFHE